MNAVLEEATGTVCVCLFRLGGVLFAVEVDEAREVIVVEDYTVVPRAPTDLVGITNLRGSVLPVVDVRPLLRLSDGRQPARGVQRGTKALVLEAGRIRAAVAIDEALGLSVVEEVIPLSEAARREYGSLAVGLFPAERELVTLLNTARILETLVSRTRRGDGIRGGRVGIEDTLEGVRLG